MARSGPREGAHRPPPAGYLANKPATGLRQFIEKNPTGRFFVESWDELAKVHWPSREETQNLVILVIASSLAVGAFLGAIDFVFAWVIQHLIGAA